MSDEPDTEMATQAPRPIDHEQLLLRPSPFGNETGKLPNGIFEPGADVVKSLGSSRVLVIGAGGLGCEILKDLAMSGFKNIHVIDMDTIDVSNLNRQFLFRQKDVGGYKSEVAANFIMSRVPSCNVVAHVGKIQDKPPEWYKGGTAYLPDGTEETYEGFTTVIAGLDNIAARRWLNDMLCSFVELDEDGDIDGEESTIIPLVDGGTEGFKGQARVILPRITSCFECSMATFTPSTVFQLCTVAENPRKPEHCIAYVKFAINGTASGKAAEPYKNGWESKFGKGAKLDKDNPAHMQYICANAINRANEYNIPPPDYMLTMGVVKSIIPAIASTNALIAACCVNEAFKIVTFASQTLDTWHQFMGASGINSLKISYEKNEACPVCSGRPAMLKVDLNTTTLRDVRKVLSEPPFSFGDCSIRGAGKTLFMNKPPALRKQTEPNLPKTLAELDVSLGDELSLTSSLLFSKQTAKIVGL